MTWGEASGFHRRPIVVVEDHLYHITQLLDALSDLAPDLLAQTTVLCLERPGPDTDATVERWRADHPDLRVAAATSEGTLDPQVFTSSNAFCRTLAGMLRPGGLLVQDIQLSTLTFLPVDRWWESIYLAATVRGMFPFPPPVLPLLLEQARLRSHLRPRPRRSRVRSEGRDREGRALPRGRAGAALLSGAALPLATGGNRRGLDRGGPPRGRRGDGHCHLDRHGQRDLPGRQDAPAPPPAQGPAARRASPGSG